MLSKEDRDQAAMPPKDIRELYRTAITTTDLPGIPKGEVVGIVKWHDYNDTWTIRSQDGILQCMIPATALERFVL